MDPRPPADYESLLRGSLQELRSLRARLAAAESAPREAVAIVGIGCRFPGGADSAESYWRMLRAGTDAIGQLPPARHAAFAALRDANGAPAAVYGGFLPEVDGFDPEFFGISPREAACIDPQQRLFLEVAWEALEDAGIPADRLAGSRTGVFAGVHSQSSDYFWLQVSDPAGVTPYTATGTALNVVPGRLSYLLDLRGPSLAVDTACSSSLVAVHAALRALRAGDCDLAVAGGVNLRLLPAFLLATSRMGEWPADFRCKTFDDAADGVISGEGCGVVVLKPLSAALRDGDRVWAVVRGAAVNQDGASLGLTAPNAEAQKDVIRRALADAGVTPERVGYVEAHGTGTPLGDPIELEALLETVGRPRAEGRCAVGSVKTNFGHLEGAAGVAGLIKAALAVHHGEVPPHLHFRTLNRNAALEGSALVVPTAPWRWEMDGGPRVAGVSSFGWSGTNAHVVLEEAPASATAPASEDGSAASPMLLPLSARSPRALAEAAERWAAFLEDGRASPADACFTAAVRRAHHRVRLAAVGGTAQELAASLRRAAAEALSPAAARPRVAFLFSGQGSQWAGMARDLMADEPVFRAAVERADAALRPLTGWSAADALRSGDADLSPTEVAQPCLFALQVGLAALWESWGIAPDAVAGHSVGEAAAAYVAGALSLEDAARVVAQRARLMAPTAGVGEMASIDLPADAVRAALEGIAGRISIAARNGPATTVVSGERAAVDALLERMRATGVHCRALEVGYAFHSPLMDGLDAALAAALGSLTAGAGRVPFFSTVTGGVMDGARLDAGYWGRNLREPVDLHGALQRLAEQGVDVVVEIGPHPVLARPAGETLRAAGVAAPVLPSLRRARPARDVLLGSLAALYRAGAAVEWRAVAPAGRCVSAPAYPWQRRRFWVDAPDPFARTAPPAPPVDAGSCVAHRLRWHAQPAPAPAGEIGGWLLLGGGPLASVLAERIEAAGGVSVSGDDGAGDHGPRSDAADVLERLLDDALQRSGGRLRGIVALAEDDGDAPAAVLRALRALAWRAWAGEPPRLWMVTRGAANRDDAGIDNAEPSAGVAALEGVGRVIAAEHPELWGGWIDLPIVAVDDEAARIADELRAGAPGARVALGPGGERRTARLEPAPEAVPPFPPASDGIYLVHGGPAALAGETARWLAGRGAGRVVLLRGAETEPEVDALAAEPGVRVEIEPDDGSGAALDRIRARAASEGTPLRGVVHLARVPAPVLLAADDPDTVSAAVAAEADAARRLEARLAGERLETFILLTPLSSTETAGQGAAWAVEAALEALAAGRRRRGLPAAAISFPWRGTAGAAGLDAADALAWAGGEGARVTPRTVAAPAVELPEPADVAAPAEVAMPAVRTRLADLAPEERGGAAERWLRGRVAQLLLLHEELDPDEPLVNLGLDSFMAVELSLSVEEALGVELPVVHFLAGASLAELTRTLAAAADDAPAETPSAPVASGNGSAAGTIHTHRAAVPSGEVLAAAACVAPGELARLLDSLDELSDEEAEAILAQAAGAGRDA